MTLQPDHKILKSFFLYILFYSDITTFEKQKKKEKNTKNILSVYIHI